MEKEAKNKAKEAKNIGKISKSLQKALEKSREMEAFDLQFGEQHILCGVDEAGRGPLAGPVVAAALVFSEGISIPYINDSKKLSPKRREEVFEEIREKAASWGIGTEDDAVIDEINILQATYRAMKKAVESIEPPPKTLLNDAVHIPGLSMTQIPLIKGDAKSRLIAGASILAKVTRDRMMEAYDNIYPEYGFAKHKGYGTKEHLEAIRKYGLCPIHRKSFCEKFLQGSMEEGNDPREETSSNVPGLLKPENTRTIGRTYEYLAEAYLQRKGILILERNFRIRQGEIDLIGMEGETLVFFEVKYRKNADKGFALEAVDAKKRQKIRKTAAYYLLKEGIGQNRSLRFDCIGFDREEICWIRNAF